MNVIGTPENETSEKVCAIASRLLDLPISSALRIGGSGNSRVYSLYCDHSQKYAAKIYFRDLADKRDRLEIEFQSLLFLSAQGIKDIPKALAISRKDSCAIYEFIEGQKIIAENIKEEDIKMAVDFALELKNLNKVVIPHHLPPASDSNFSVRAIFTNMEKRLNRLLHLEGDEKEYQDLEIFLEEDFKPFMKVLLSWVRAECSSKGISFDTEIPAQQRTLSPSDFGFHNALRAPDGRIIFLDFEYFGWDDPAKMVVDFLLHPAMALSESRKENFVRGMLEVFKDNKGLYDRVRVVYPLHGLKWCAIFLNEFIPGDFSRRSFAATKTLDASHVRRQQLLKAINLFRKIQKTYHDFPYVNG